MEEGQKVGSVDDLLLANLLQVSDLLKKGENVIPFIDHIIFLIKKNQTRLYKPRALISYDKAIKAKAGEKRGKGPQVLSETETDAVNSCFCYDNTWAADVTTNSSSSKPKSKSSKAKASNSSNTCNNWNYAAEGCRSTSCKYPHQCKLCKSPNHVASECSSKSAESPAGASGGSK